MEEGRSCCGGRCSSWVLSAGDCHHPHEAVQLLLGGQRALDMASSLLQGVSCESDGWTCAQSLAVPLRGRTQLGGEQPPFTLGAPSPLSTSRAPAGEGGYFERSVGILGLVPRLVGRDLAVGRSPRPTLAHRVSEKPPMAARLQHWNLALLSVLFGTPVSFLALVEPVRIYGWCGMKPEGGAAPPAPCSPAPTQDAPSRSPGSSQRCSLGRPQGRVRVQA